jgi:hypothetical protein
LLNEHIQALSASLGRGQVYGTPLVFVEQIRIGAFGKQQTQRISVVVLDGLM